MIPGLGQEKWEVNLEHWCKKVWKCLKYEEVEILLSSLKKKKKKLIHVTTWINLGSIVWGEWSQTLKTTY